MRITNYLKEYKAKKETKYLSSSPEMMKRLRNAEKSIAEGKGVEIDINKL